MLAKSIELRSTPLQDLLHRHVSKVIFVGDIAAIFLACFVAMHISFFLRTFLVDSSQVDVYSDFLLQRTLQLYVLASGLCLYFGMKGHYSARQPFLTEAANILAATLVAALVDGYLQFVLKDQPSRLWLGTTWALVALFLLLTRLAAKHALFRMGPWRCPVTLVGSASAIEQARRVLGQDRYVGHVVADTLILGGGAAPEERLAAAVRAGTCRYVLIAIDDHETRTAADVARYVDEKLGVPYGIVPTIKDIAHNNLRLCKFFGHDLIVLQNDRAHAARSTPNGKRLFDIVGAAAALLFLSPLMLLVALLIRLDGGPALYGSPRIGRDGRTFRALKFRSMVPNADAALQRLLAENEALRAEWEAGYKLRRDPRITTIGRFIRTTSIDELPQLLNVLKGEMSLVGPRPLLLDERRQYSDRAFELYQQVTPGLTGLWQVSGRNDLAYQRRIELNNWYIKNWSPWVDLVILVKTILVVLRRIGAS